MASSAPGVTAPGLEPFERIELDERAAAELQMNPGPLELLRAWPRDDRRASFVYQAADGSRTAGQWRPDRDELRMLAGATARRSAAGGVAVAWPVMLQSGGADRRIPALSALAAVPGAHLVSHRPERRGVVRLPDGLYAKVLPDERVAEATYAALAAADLGGGDFTAPVPIPGEGGGGLIVMDPLPGVSLHELLRNGGPAATTAAAAAGRALRALHSRRAPSGLPHHGPVEAAEVMRMWVRRAKAWAPATAATVEPLVRDVEQRLGDAPTGRLGPVHRDMHDKQVLVDEQGGVGILDFDLLSVGEPAGDLANLLVHLDLRRLLGSREDGAREALLAGYDPPASVESRLPAYADAVRLRLACVYALRPRSRARAVDPLLDRLGTAP